MMKKIDPNILPQRNFYPGSKWVYIKIYGGIGICDNLLSDTILPAMNGLIRNGLIKQWFFIRYSDPDFHIRLRIELINIQAFGAVVAVVNKKFSKLCDSRKMIKFMIDTYSREIERYGALSIDSTEQIFCIDSDYVCKILRELRNKNPNFRWMTGFYLIDSFLECFDYNFEEKLKVIGEMSRSYSLEFGFNEHNLKQLNSVYRNRRNSIRKVLEKQFADDEWNRLYTIMDVRKKRIKNVLNSTKLASKLNVISLIHMTMNRLFATQNRFHEMVMYYFLTKYYKSSIAIDKIENKKIYRYEEN